ncbi:uncharacterized protein LOC126778105 isoform X2 [Nymphalis io]|uniref:uncharacterized protein LOC126778105 isoform X2 n=1 Tax=Inachis io TaxID=171585 RepID=UPI00216707D2|nr:uncharacterized protein LOC126778105 isoform X2 [Nymphalis io]
MMTFKWINIFIFTHIITSKCSQVIDEHNQKGLHISDYCPKIGSCEEGSHVMCIYYNPIKKMGSTCSNAANISITPEFAQMILDIVNRIRSKVTAGSAKGRDGTNLPKGYGIYRLNWDEELATFAQVWANQCILKSDLCRDTKKFPNVGQTLGMSRFTVDDWQPLHSPNYLNSSTLTQDKVKYAITAVMKAWYDMRADITAEDIKLTVDRSSKTLGNQFIYLIYGNVTHIGCGISAYREYAYHDNNAALNYNSIQIVCNYSARLHSGYPVYTTDPPTKPGYTVKCGCPLGYDEDDDCLCYESKRKLPYTCKDSSRCKPSVVVLPIFTVDDAPKALHDLGNNNATLVMNTREVFDRYDLNSQRTNGISFNKQRQRFAGDVRSRYFGRNMGSSMNHRADISHQLPRVGSNRRSKQSVFLKAPIFDLNVRKSNPMTHQKLVNKKDVAPRKDFTEVQQLVSEYLDKKRYRNTFDADKESDGYISHEPLTFHSYNNPNTFKNQNVFRNSYNDEQKYNNNNFNLNKNLNLYDDVKVVNVDGDRKIMALLDSLEQKIKEIELDTNEKEVFDEKIRKIYEALVGKSDFKEKYKLNVLWNNNSKANEVNNYNIKVDSKGMLRNYNFDSMRPEDYSYRDVNDNHPSYDGDLNKNFSRYNWNKDDTKHLMLNLNLDDIENRGMRNAYNFRKKIQRNLENGDYYLKNINDEDLMESNRRRYYDNKLATLRRKIDLMKRNVYQHKVHQDRKLRPVRPTKPAEEQKTYIKSKESMNTFYMPDRARFLHGF